ncbi:MAG: hypothetical protein V3W09_04330 [Nitrososphaerales archaeon]
MPSIELFVSLKVDGFEAQSLGFPIKRRVEVDEFQPFAPYEKANDGDDTTFTALPIGGLPASTQVLIYQAVDQALGLRTEGGEATNVANRLNAGGIIVMIDAAITTSNLTDNNNSGAIAKVKGAVGGT